MASKLAVLLALGVIASQAISMIPLKQNTTEAEQVVPEVLHAYTEAGIVMTLT